VVPGYAPEDFEQLRFWATSADGTAVPYTVARRRGAPPGPVHLYGYGAYGLGEMPSFSSARLLLLERGVTCVLAHVRGGDELGQRWYRAATGAGREHTFADFLAISEALIAEGLGDRGASPSRAVAPGGSWWPWR
jgi:oligopeptidase B